MEATSICPWKRTSVQFRHFPVAFSALVLSAARIAAGIILRIRRSGIRHSSVYCTTPLYSSARRLTELPMPGESKWMKDDERERCSQRRPDRLRRSIQTSTRTHWRKHRTPGRTHSRISPHTYTQQHKSVCFVYLLPIVVQRRPRREVAGVVDVLQLAKNVHAG